MAAAALALNILLARMLSVEAMGHIRVVRTVLDLAAIPALWGMGACVAKYVADRRADAGQRRRTLAAGFAIAGGCSVAVAALLYGLLLIPGLLRDGVAVEILRSIVWVLPGVALFGCGVGYLQGAGRIGGLAALQAGRAAALLAAAGLLAWQFGLTGWAWGRAGAEIFGGGLALALAWGWARPRFDARLARSMFAFGGFAMTAQAMTTLMTSIDVLCLDRIVGDAAVMGQYGIATFMFATATLPAGALVQAGFARMAEAGADPAETWRRYRRYSGLAIAIGAPAAAVGFLAAPAIPWIFGADFAPAAEIFRWFMPALAIKSWSVVGAAMVIGAGRVRANFAGSVAAVAVNLILNLALIPRFGVAGAVVATTCGFALRCGLSAVILNAYRRSAPA